jgi:hypothetical protein
VHEFFLRIIVYLNRLNLFPRDPLFPQPGSPVSYGEIQRQATSVNMLGKEEFAMIGQEPASGKLELIIGNS